MTCVDSNILIDIATRDPDWSLWSLAQLERASLHGQLVICDVVYAELAVRYDTIKHLDGFLSDAQIEVVHLPKTALFLAGQAFARYRKAGGKKSGVLPDFFIGAHASVVDAALITRDVRRYRTYFPQLQLIAPEND